MATFGGATAKMATLPARRQCCHASRRRGFLCVCACVRVRVRVCACACVCVLPRYGYRSSRCACLRVQVEHDHSIHPIICALPAAFAPSRHLRCISIISRMHSKHGDSVTYCEIFRVVCCPGGRDCVHAVTRPYRVKLRGTVNSGKRARRGGRSARSPLRCRGPVNVKHKTRTLSGGATVVNTTSSVRLARHQGRRAPHVRVPGLRHHA